MIHARLTSSCMSNLARKPIPTFQSAKPAVHDEQAVEAQHDTMNNRLLTIFDMNLRVPERRRKRPVKSLLPGVAACVMAAPPIAFMG